MFQAVAIHPAMRHFQGHFSRVHESPSQNMPVRLATRSQADWQNQFRKLLPVQQSPQQKVMTEARRILQHNRQTDPSYAALPAFFGLDEQAQVQFSNPGSQDRNDPRMEQLAVMHGVSTSALQVCLFCVPAKAALHLPWTALLACSEGCILLLPAACTGMCGNVCMHHTIASHITSMLVQALQHLLPDLCLNAHQNPQLVKALAADTCVIASRLLQLKAWFPSANISKMVADRSHMLAVMEAHSLHSSTLPHTRCACLITSGCMPSKTG